MSNHVPDDIGERYRAGLVAGLDLPVKVRMLTGLSWFTFGGGPEIGLGEILMSDGMTGVRGAEFHGGPQVTLLPGATSVSSAWDEDLAYQVGRLLGGRRDTAGCSWCSARWPTCTDQHWAVGCSRGTPRTPC